MGSLNPFRLMRITSIMSDQSWALRIRSFVNYLKNNPKNRALLLIGSTVSDAECANAEFAKNYPTNLCKPNRSGFERLASHGYTVAANTQISFGLE